MVSSAEILAAVRELTNVKQLERGELHDLLQDGILAALAKKYGPTVQAEVSIDDGRVDRPSQYPPRARRRRQLCCRRPVRATRLPWLSPATLR